MMDSLDPSAGGDGGHDELQMGVSTAAMDAANEEEQRLAGAASKAFASGAFAEAAHALAELQEARKGDPSVAANLHVARFVAGEERDPARLWDDLWADVSSLVTSPEFEPSDYPVATYNLCLLMFLNRDVLSTLDMLQRVSDSHFFYWPMHDLVFPSLETRWIATAATLKLRPSLANVYEICEWPFGPPLAGISKWSMPCRQSCPLPAHPLARPSYWPTSVPS